MKKMIILLSLIALALSGCGSAGPAAGAPVKPDAATEAPAATQMPTAVPTAKKTATPVPLTETPAPTPTTAASMFPQVTFSEDVICRMGPEPNYYRVIKFTKGQTTPAYGRIEDASWISVETRTPNKDPFCWVPITSVEDFGDANALRVVSVAPLPEAPVTLTATQGVCGTTADNMGLEWSPVAQGVGYYVYRNGKNIGTVYGGKFRDFETPRSKKPYVYVYVVQAFNAAGTSIKTVSTTVTLCP